MGGPEQPPPVAKLSARDRWLLLGLLLLALVLGIGTGLGIGMSSRFEAARAVATRAPECGARRESADAIASLVAAPIQPDPAPSAVAPPGEKAPVNDRAASASATQPTPHRRAPRPRRAPADDLAQSRPLGPDLHEALKLLRAAQQALRASNATRALSLLDEMARRTPDVLVEEREVTRTLAHCAANDVDSARRAAAALREVGVARVYAHRLSQSCVGPEPAPASLLDEMRQRALN